MGGARIFENTPLEFRRWLAENGGCEYRREVFLTAIIGITAPTIFHEILVCLCWICQAVRPPSFSLGERIKWIEMYIIRDVQEVCVRVYAYSFRSPLE